MSSLYVHVLKHGKQIYTGTFNAFETENTRQIVNGEQWLGMARIHRLEIHLHLSQ